MTGATGGDQPPSGRCRASRCVTGTLHSCATAEIQYGKDNPHLYGWVSYPEPWARRMGRRTNSGQEELGDLGSKSVDNDLGDGTNGSRRGFAFGSDGVPR
jgi:hypothetical protein